MVPFCAKADDPEQRSTAGARHTNNLFHFLARHPIGHLLSRELSRQRSDDAAPGRHPSQASTRTAIRVRTLADEPAAYPHAVSPKSAAAHATLAVRRGIGCTDGRI